MIDSEHLYDDFFDLVNDIVTEFKHLKPKRFIDLEELYDDRYYITLSRTVFIVVNGYTGHLNSIQIYRNNHLIYDITTNEGIEAYCDNNLANMPHSDLLFEFKNEGASIKTKDILLIIKHELARINIT
jgi:hypothetical protein